MVLRFLRLLLAIRKNLVHIKWTLHASLDFSFLDNRLRESLHTNRASLTLALLGRTSAQKKSNTLRFSIKNIARNLAGKFDEIWTGRIF